MGLRDRNKVMLRTTEHHFILVAVLPEHPFTIMGLGDQHKVMLRKTEHHFILVAVQSLSSIPARSPDQSRRQHP